MYENDGEQGMVRWSRSQASSERPDEPAHPAPPRRRPRGLLIGALALAFALTLGVGAFFGSAILPTVQAAGPTTGSTDNFQLPLASTPGARGTQGGPGAQGQCGVLTVTRVSGSTIVTNASDGSSVTIRTTSSTQYTHNGQSASASAVTVGAQIHVDGTRNSDGSITATRIDVG